MKHLAKLVNPAKALFELKCCKCGYLFVKVIRDAVSKLPLSEDSCAALVRTWGGAGEVEAKCPRRCA